MTDTPFVYDENLLANCTLSAFASSQSLKDAVNLQEGSEIKNPPSSCQALFQQHAEHYGRRHIDKFDKKQRLYNFIRSAARVHRRNGDLLAQKDGNHFHKVSLNQFSDLFNHELPLIKSPSSSSPFYRHDGGLQLEVIQLDTRESIEYWANELSYRRSPLYDDMYVNHHGGDHNIFDDPTKKGDRGQHNGKQNDPFATSLNWATRDNPDGAGVVNTPIDQGPCGSCWAFAATGTLEASIARSAVLQDNAYTQPQARTGNLKSTRTTQVNSMSKKKFGSALSTNFNHNVEIEPLPTSLESLSAQELVDCDTWGDRGCNGGNPMVAFNFIHRYGLTTSSRYPYRASENQCNVEAARHPVATTQSWGVLPPNYENNMESVVRQLGPVAVGVNAADPDFLAYAGGIFNSVDCGMDDANHAMLIVGYGEEEIYSRIVKYWIVKNSWGTGWGEGGYVRLMRRSNGKQGEEGVCGIAQNPSIALGGSLVQQHQPTKPQPKHSKHHSQNNNYYWQQQQLEEKKMPNSEEQSKDGFIRLGCRKLGHGHDGSSCERIGSMMIFSTFALCVMAMLAMTVRAFQGRRKKQERELLTIEGRINETFHLIARGNDGDNNNYNNGIGNSNDDDKNDVPTCYGSSLEECSHFSLRTL